MSNELKVTGKVATILVVVAALGQAAALLARGWSSGAAAAMGGFVAATASSILVLYRHEIDVFGPRKSGSKGKTQVAWVIAVGYLCLLLTLVVILQPR